MSQSTKVKKPAPSPELSETTRAAIIKALENGDPAAKISKDLRVARSTVYRTRTRFEERKDLTSKPRSGRPSTLSEQTTRYIARLARKHDRPSWAAIAATVDGGLSRSTVKRVACRQNGHKKPLEKVSTTSTVKKSSKKAAVRGKGPEPAK
jgi:transposase